MAEIKQPETESEENSDDYGSTNESDNKMEINVPKEVYEKEMAKIKLNPREYICDWMENNLMHVGRRAFKLICLLPCSMIIPSIPFGSTGIKANINTFILGSPACGKSTLTKKFCGISYYPINLKGVSAKKLMDKINDSGGMFSLGIDDFSNILDQPDGYETIKILEGALGDEKIASHENMQYSKKVLTQASGMLCGTWSDLKKYSNYMKGGLLSRMSLLFISINKRQREDIADFINKNIGNVENSQESLIKEKIVKEYYRLLFQLQGDLKTQVKGYHIDENFKGMALNTWKRMIDNHANDMNGDFKREFHDFYRYFVSHAFLNIFNRKMENGILYPIKEDYEFALRLMEETLGNKTILLDSKIFIKDIDSPEKLLKFISEPKIKEDVKNIILNLSPFAGIISSSYKDKNAITKK